MAFEKFPPSPEINEASLGMSLRVPENTAFEWWPFVDGRRFAKVPLGENSSSWENEATPEPRPPVRLSRSEQCPELIYKPIDRSANAVRKSEINDDPSIRRDFHIHTERKRRRHMSNLFTVMQSLIPSAKSAKKNRCMILKEVIDHIQSLQEELKQLVELRADIIADKGNNINAEAQGKGTQSWGLVAATIPCVTVAFFGDNALITVNSSKKKGILPRIFMILEENDLHVQNAILSFNEHCSYHYFHAKVPHDSQLQRDDLQKTLNDIVAGQFGA